ncbi:MAG TPA: nuclear transport factor 2 family protein, partial [Mycobacterium sp.]|nr:nuclear transport factor 2 family protein [Mycobacterium sp.]
LERWFEIIASGGSGDVEELLADDAVFYSPAVFTPQRGRAQAAAYLRAAEKLFAGANFRYVGKWFDAHSAVLEFAAEIDGLTVEGIDMIHWNADGKIVSVKVMIRPLKALQAIVPKMTALLQG